MHGAPRLLEELVTPCALERVPRDSLHVQVIMRRQARWAILQVAAHTGTGAPVEDMWSCEESANGEIIELDRLPNVDVGGKADGLARLIAMGLRVPPAFVIRNAVAGTVPAGLGARRDALGPGPVAVRSSASGEDGAEASFAGQYETVLDVDGAAQLRDAIDRCVASARSGRASSYRQTHDAPDADDEPATMHVVVQLMVDAACAGVVFTADPVSARRDLLVIDVVAGLGEALVSGETTPDHFAVDDRGEIVRRHLVGENALLTDPQILTIAEQARAAADHEGRPLDLEWAIDQHGELFWLQARPITTLPSDLAELDTVLPRPDDVLTISNIGEMMPGAVCPLTASFTGGGIDHGLQHMQVAVGARDWIDERWQITAVASGHLFLNLTGNIVMAAGTLGSSAQQTAMTLCGRIVDELDDLPPLPMWRRIVNSGRLLRYCVTAPAVVAEFGADLDAFTIDRHANAAASSAEIASKLWFFDHAMAVHIQSSALSGLLCALVENIVAERRADSTIAEQAEAVRLLAGATDVESAMILDELDLLVDAIAEAPDADQRFVGAEVDAARAWLDATPALAAGFADFLARHGHRGYRELCVRDPSWGDDPAHLIRSMQASVRARLVTGVREQQTSAPIDIAALSSGLRRILPNAHRAIRRREHTKSQLVDLAHRFQLAFRDLGAQMAGAGLIPDPDLVCFFTIDEIGEFIANPSPGAVDHALDRRRALDHQQLLRFPEISVGVPRPREPEPVALTDGVLHGRPASRGVVEGLVRVAVTLDEAAALLPGEILVTPITDIGWTPYFGMIGGLVTDLGSSVSHGAVVAREYGLPCVVNARTATRVLHDGDRVRLDGDTGTVTVLT